MKRFFFLCVSLVLTMLPAVAQYRVTVAVAPVSPEDLTDGVYAIRATTAGETGYIYNASTSSGENFRVSNVSHPNELDDKSSDCQYFWQLVRTGNEGEFTLRNLATGNYLPADNTRNLNCTQDVSVAALLQTDDEGVLWQTNYDYHGSTLYLHTNYRSDDRCLSYWNELGTPGEGTALQVEFFPAEIEPLLDVRVGNGKFYRQNRYSVSEETSNSVYKYVSTSTRPQLTIEAEGPTNNIDVPDFNWFSGKNLSQIYTMTMSEGYRITGYEIIFNNGDASVPMTITPAEGGIAVRAEDNAEAFLSVTDLHAQSTSFTISADEHKPAHISSFLVYYEEPHTATFELWDGDNVVLRDQTSAFEGDKLVIPESFTNIPYSTLSWDTPSLMTGEDMTVRVNYTWNGPFKLSTKETSPRYFLCIGDSVDADGNVDHWNPLSFIDAETYEDGRFVLGVYGDTGSPDGLGQARNLKSASGLWSFEGSAWDGFKIRNANGRLLAAAPVEPGSDSGKSIRVQLVDDDARDDMLFLWDVAPADGQGIENGFYLRQHGTQYSLNERQDGAHFFLAFWTTGESRGSVFRVSRTLPEREALRVSGIAYSTSYYPFATQIPSDANLAAYAVALSADGKSADLNELPNGLIPPGEPVLLKGEDNVPLIVAEEERNRVEDNLLVGTLDTVSVPAENRSDYLVLSWVLRPGFFVSNTLTSILPHTAYLDNTLLAASRGLPIGTVTAVETITRNVLENDTVYDLQGRRVTVPVHGIYIINGRKLFVK